MSAENRIQFLVRIPESLRRQVKHVAQRHGRSAAKEVQKVLEMHVEKFGDSESRSSALSN